MTTFVDHQHPRTGNGRFATKDHAEAELELAGPVITLSEATGDWGPRCHDIDFRSAYEYTPSERAAAAFRTQFGAAPDAEVDGEYYCPSSDRAVLKIQATGRVAVRFPGSTRFAAEGNMLSVMDRLAGNDAAWRRGDPLTAESFDEVFYDDEYKNYERERYLGASRSLEDAEDGYRHELSHLHRGLAGWPAGRPRPRSTSTLPCAPPTPSSSTASPTEPRPGGLSENRSCQSPPGPRSSGT